MSEFDAAREELSKARHALAAERSALYAVQQERARLEAKLARATRAPSRDSQEEVARLRKQLEQAKAEETRTRSAANALESAVAGRVRMFGSRADPRNAISNCNGDIPILLLPVRLETRFHQARSAEGLIRDELWVRIYPDDCSVDGFEPALSEEDVACGQRFWTAAWAAGGVESERRAAWRDLVAARGSGRAAWIIRQYRPEGSEPAKANAEDVLLVITATQAPPSSQQAALADYWKAVWAADGSAAVKEQAQRALAQSLGLNAADAATLIAHFTPANVNVRPAPPLQKADVTVDVVWLTLPTPSGLKTSSWTTPPQVRALPDRFVVLGYQDDKVVFEAQGAMIPSPLIAGPDPSAPPAEQLQHGANGELVVPDDMRWMTDFDRAVEVGMGLKVPLDPARLDLSRPISRVIALGLRLSESAEAGRAQLEQLLTAHRYGHAGMALVPQGTPTNNTDGEPAGYRRDADADDAYDALFAPARQLTITPDWHSRQDGQWLADALGIDPEILQGVLHAGARDFAEARAMNRALWPATLGYAMESMLHPLFGAAAVDATRWFYSHFVAGRGFLPCVRIGEQPYGVLPVSALSQWNPASDPAPIVGGLPPPEGFGAFLPHAMSVLSAMRGDWANLAKAVSHVGKPGDAHQTLLDIIGLHPASVEFHQRYAESFAFLFNRAKFDGLGAQLLNSVRTLGLEETAMQLLRRLGYQGQATPDALQRYFFTRSQRLNGPIIDDRPLSERDPVRPYTSDDRNYLEWLADAARGSLEELRLERGFKDDHAPEALLYLTLRHALLLGYWDSALRLHVAGGALDAAAALAARREPSAIHIAADRSGSESRFAQLYSRDERASGNARATVGERIPSLLGRDRSTNLLAEQLSALDLIKNTPTARLERCFAEHLDTTSFRLDSWLLGLVHMKLASMRYRELLDEAGAPRGEVETRRGVYLGAYGLLENLQRRQPLQPARLSDDLAAIFAPDGQPAPLTDPANGGFMLAPSISQAATSAVLRAGFLANASPQAPEALAVNLSSARVRLALELIEGVRNGQPLGALLGYRFQRQLHEDHAPVELDVFIHAMRPHFPLVANNIASTLDPSAAIETIEANNVIDGLKLIDHVRTPEKRLYPFGLPLPAASVSQRAAIDAEVDRLLDAHDALADLALAEGVHQSVLGNYDRVAGVLDAYAKGTFPPEPELVRTPRGGVTLTHRVGVHFDAAAISTVSVASSPRAHALAPVNKWLAGILPPPTNVGCSVEWLEPATGTAQQELVTQQDLALQPIDLLYIATLDGEAAMSELEDRIVRHVVAKRAPRCDAVLSVRHAVRLPAPMNTFFEHAPLLRHLRTVLLRSRPLAPTDIALPGEAERAQDAFQSIPRDRAAAPVSELEALATDLAAFDAAALTIDAAVDQAVALFERAARFGLQQVGWGFVYAWRRRVFTGLLSRVQEVVARWRTRLSDFVAAAAAYDAAAASMTDEQRFDALSALDLRVAALPLSPRPATPAAYETALYGQSNPQARRRLFAGKLSALEAVLAAGTSSLSTLVAAIQAQLPLSAFDLDAFGIDGELADIDAFKRELQSRAVKLKQEIDRRTSLAREALDAHDATTSPALRVERLQAAGSALFGADVKLTPQFTLAPAQASEFANAYAHGSSGALTQYLRMSKQVMFPVDDWLHGVARVREKLHAWEQAGLYAPVLGGSEPALTPMQLPFRAGEGWLAMEFDPQQSLEGEHILYTAHFAVAPNAGATCGLLIDEWTEVLPARDETVGLSFHYDRPSSEPAQAWLLATPPRTNEPWRWADLLGAVLETFELAKLRAVEPAHVDTTSYANVLPATASAATLHGVSISTDFARVNSANAFVRGDTDG